MNVKIHYVQVREFLAQGRGNWVMATVGRETSALFSGVGDGTHTGVSCLKFVPLGSHLSFILLPTICACGPFT